MSGFPGGGGGFDFEEFEDLMGNASSLTLEEYEKYAGASTVKDFYYTLTAYFNGDGLLPVTDDSSSSNESSGDGGGMGFPGNFGGMFGGMASGDFSIVGYSSYSAMTDFMDGTATIVDGGTMFEEGTTDYTCVISYELATYNSLEVGAEIIVCNPSVETETYTLTITGIYKSSSSNDFSLSMFGSSQDPANAIYMSSAALQNILDESASVSTTTENDYGIETETKVTGSLSATYAFADTDAYYVFEDEVRTLGLDDSYTVSSPDISAYESSLAPLKTLSKMAGWFLIVILIIGAIILVVLNIFNVRERKYEVGVLTAMGMKKWKVAAQFICEILVVTMIAVVIGAGIGAVGSVPVTNALLKGQIASQSAKTEQLNENFGFPGGGSFPGGGQPSGMPSFGGENNPFEEMMDDNTSYISKVDSAMDLTVVFQMIGVGLILTLVASAASVLFIMRYDPLKILSNRD